MRKFAQIAAISAAILALLPMAALAHDGEDGEHGLNANLGLHANLHSNRSHNGTVTAVGSTSFTLQTEDGTFTVNTANAKIMQAFGVAIQLGDIHVNDNAKVNGQTNGTTIDAKNVLVTPPNTHRASGGGKVTAINGSNLTVQQNNHGIISSFTVSTNASTTVVTKNGTATTTAAIQVGSKIRVHGLWDEIANLLKAIKIKIW